jgi:ABC-type glycerol-3-phosphate transport system substrate-binding protein
VASLLAAALLLAVLAAAGCGGDDDEGGGSTESKALALDPADFSPQVDNPFFPLSEVPVTIFEGSEPSP